MFGDFIEILRSNFNKILDEVDQKINDENTLNEFIYDLLDYGYKMEYNIYTNQCVELSKIVYTLYLPILDIIPDSIIQLDDVSQKIDQLCEDQFRPIFLVPSSFVKQIYYVAISQYLKVKGSVINKVKKLITLIRDQFIEYFNMARLNFELGQISTSWNNLWWSYSIANEEILLHFSNDKKFIEGHHRNNLEMIRRDWINNP